MRSGMTAQMAIGDTGYGIKGFLHRQLTRVIGLAVFALVAFCLASLGTWNVADPSFSFATDNPVTNAMGYPGAVFADLAMQFFGLSSVLALVPALAWGFWLVSARGIDRMPTRAVAWFAGSVLAAGLVGCVGAPPTWPLPSGLGGVFGDLTLNIPSWLAGGYPSGAAAVLTALVLAGPAMWLLLFGSGAISRPAPAPDKPVKMPVKRRAVREEEVYEEEDDEEEDDRGGGMLAIGAVVHWWLSVRAFLRRKLSFAAPVMARVRSRPEEDDDEFADFAPSPRRAAPRVEPGFGAPSMPEIDPPFDMDDDGYDDFDDDTIIRPTSARAAPAGQPQVQNFRSPTPARVENPAPRPQPGARVQREAQTSFIGSGDFEMPSLHFLSEPKNVARDPSLSKDALEQNARLLEGVLEDFGVKGEIIHVRPGPVVTLYELEPAPGIKSSRVIGLADDIARSMSSIACRVAVVPGRNAIGIELPNSKRETVYLREILASKDFEVTKARLALALGKTINGEAVIADIAKMPHVLVAGTTGSGKSVAINTMILSILYRMTPEQCRLIMIDPKMLELSVYDGIPHLLTPVVTDPKKAVVALKWTVREMEDRYRKMSKVGVRNIDGFNQRVGAAQKKGERISRTVQTGFDRETGEAIYETEDLDLEPMPYIVVIIDEMADLMMVAGKDIEGAVQRLAQMARAAGIHVIMATQRPSVDVITGTIKANFPTRISFQVTSKIDSRTILGEQGAEQLLGMGDMLYMAGGGRIQRVHGPFVSDEEVEKVVAHLKLQGVPEYLDAITEDDEDDEDGGSRGGGSGGGFEDSEDPYDQAVAVVLRDGKASTSYIQRRLGIGYNRAASIIERMEQEGIVGPANHAGKREILVPTEDDKF
ncbi:DNA translocase FtsK [Aquamicrobium sp. LC103]|uniref:DNA translocase FtsK n=1 Tax=Aquamicrobium sp. LC103 TaxID=1120658 RepID=UPI00063E7EAD|nr:DNA translocase FtsK [Aquamicrobium sp. LC103]TKT82920.1 DNA translocase FtsK [Aquamicrobium sp. LC103]